MLKVGQFNQMKLMLTNVAQSTKNNVVKVHVTGRLFKHKGKYKNNKKVQEKYGVT